MQIGELAKKVGISTQAIRYYERIGLLKISARTPSGYRLYDQESEAFLQFVKKAQDLGFTLQEIKTIWGIKVSGEKPCRYVAEQLQEKIRDVEEKIMRLEEFRDLLLGIHRKCQESEPSLNVSYSICPIIESAVDNEGR
jgi:MerR family transcriptional regulator, copper efflux regulator